MSFILLGFKRIAALMLVASLVFMLSGCGMDESSDQTASDGSLQKVLDSGQLVLGLDEGFPPMGFKDDNADIVGFDIDVAKEVCNRLGVKLVTKGIDWDTKEECLNNGEIDCIWNGMSITPERENNMNLSEPYMKNELIFVVRGNSDIKGIRDLSGKTIGVQSGASAQEALETSDLYSDNKVELFDDNITLFEQLEKGKVDVALVDSVVAYYSIFLSDKQFFVLPESLDEEQYAIGFRKNDKELRDRVCEIISQMKTDGTLGDISKKWFGSDITIVK